MSFKYQKEIDNLPCDCPDLSEFKPHNGQVFRFVHSNLNHPDNFKPVNFIEDREHEDCKSKCAGYGLSFWMTKGKAEKKLTNFIKNAPNFAQRVGTCVAEGIICQHDGLIGQKSGSGHVTFHEFEETVFNNRFVIVTNLNQ
ncbi:hypothetical protein [Mucilaginibacter sp. BT774]|uniref:hypothetical protein n=1 Tax=Mucilaginibacter sp. BT774 TaxID=3062276 RepID=UPI002674527E|nr:hypothetical protein [Mucilaginibacter sp. BT774]MDO3627274.1 hypothetical protein [Mucilaginibacter sp. BT774]